MGTINISFSGSAEEIGRLLIGLDDLGYIDLQDFVDPFIKAAMDDLERPSWVVELAKYGGIDFQKKVNKARRKRRQNEKFNCNEQHRR